LNSDELLSDSDDNSIHSSELVTQENDSPNNNKDNKNTELKEFTNDLKDEEKPLDLGVISSDERPTDSYELESVKTVDSIDSSSKEENLEEETREVEGDKKNSNLVTSHSTSDMLDTSNVLSNLDNSISNQIIPNLGKLFIEVKSGHSAYDINVWDETFKVGMLTRRPFDASGYNFNLEIGYQISKWFNPIIGLNYNVKNTNFSYSALYDDKGWLTQNIQGNIISIDDINDQDYLCNKYILKDINAEFKITSYTLTFGNKMNLFEFKKIGLDTDLKYNLDLNSSVKINQISKIDVSKYLKQTMNSRFSGGVNVYFKLNDRFKVFLYPEYVFKWRSKKQSLYQGKYHELISSVGIRIHI
jgi:hypothetical protein